MDIQKTANASVLGEMKPSKAIIKLAVPATLALLAKAVYNIVDTAYIGMLHSDTALAGRQLGAKDQEGAGITVMTIVALSVVIGMILCVGGLFFMEPLLRSFGASEAVLPQAKDYALWMFIAALASLPAWAGAPSLKSSRGLFLSMSRQGLFYVPFILILPRLLGVTGIYFAQPAADVLTILICVLSIRSMKRTASRNMKGNS